MRDRCCEILAEKMGVTLKQFLRRFTRDTYLPARQAVEMGLADRVVEPHAALSLVTTPALKAC